MDIDCVVDKQGNKYKIKTFLNYGAILCTCTLPELRPIASVCYGQDGRVFNGWRDSGYSGKSALDNNAAEMFDVIRKDWLLPHVDSLYSLIHPSNKSAVKSALTSGGYCVGQEIIDGEVYDKYMAPIVGMTARIKEKWKVMV